MRYLAFTVVLLAACGDDSTTYYVTQPDPPVQVPAPPVLEKPTEPYKHDDKDNKERD